MRRVGRVAALLGCDAHDFPRASQVREVLAHECGSVVTAHVLEHMGEEQGREIASLRVSRVRKPVGRVGDEAPGATIRNGLDVVVDPDPVAIEVLQIAADAATDIERTPEVQPSQVPSVRALHRQGALPAYALEVGKASGVGRVSRRIVGRAHPNTRAPRIVTVRITAQKHIAIVAVRPRTKDASSTITIGIALRA